VLPFVPLLPQLPNKQYGHLLEEFRADPLAYHGGLRARVLTGAYRTMMLLMWGRAYVETADCFV
jgi:hypothetical protein